jgi:hypothetical protein
LKLCGAGVMLKEEWIISLSGRMMKWSHDEKFIQYNNKDIDLYKVTLRLAESLVIKNNHDLFL